MATSRSKPARRMSQPSPLAQRSGENDDDADDKLFLPVSRSSSNLGIFQLPPPPALNRQDSRESSSSENDPAQSPSSVSRTGSLCPSRSPFSLNCSTPGAAHVTSPATISTSAAKATGSNDTNFSTLPFSSTLSAAFRTPSPPQWAENQLFSNFSQDDQEDDEVFNSQSGTFDVKNPFRPPSPYGEVVEPLSPVVMNGNPSFEESDIKSMVQSQAHNKTVRSTPLSHVSPGQKSSAPPPPPSPTHGTTFFNSSTPPNKKTLASIAASSRATNYSTKGIFSHSNLNDNLSSTLLNNDHLLKNRRKKDLSYSLSLENPGFNHESHTENEFTNVSLNNDFFADISNSNDSNSISATLPEHQDDNHHRNYNYNNNKNNNYDDRLSSLYFNKSDNNNRGNLIYHSFDSDHDSAFPTIATGVNQSTNNNNNNNHYHHHNHHHYSSSDSTSNVKTRRMSIVDGLLQDIRDRLHLHGRSDSVDSDTMTECSSTSDAPFSHHSYGMPGGGYHVSHLNRSVLQNQSPAQLKRKLMDLQRSSAQMNASLVKHLKRRDRHLARQQRNCDIVTAVLQASSLKRQIDTRMKFSLQPPPGESAFDQWRDAMKAVCRLPMGIPSEFRKKAWLSLADHYLFQLKINWEKTVRFVFNERSNPDDEQLGEQIVKDLHRTGCSNFSGEENEEDRAILKRLLLAYARWNKRVGYCQGFNVIAALLLNVMDRREDDALKVMIYLIDSVLPESYFANNLRALSVDMAVFRDLLRLTYPRLSNHLDKLQLAAQDVRTGACYEPPLPNVFTMQWFLTLFATCLPIPTVLRVWDSILLEGSEILLRTALTIWGRLAKRIMSASSADEFYCLMGELTSSIMQGSILEGDAMIKSIYGLGEFPFPQLHELREKYTYNIRPFTPASAASGNGSNQNKVRTSLRSLLHLKYNDDEDLDDDDITAMACMPGDVSGSSDISVLGPGVYGEGRGATNGGGRGSEPHTMERMSTDIQSLKMQYERLKQRQQQAHIIIAAASAKKAPPPSQQQHRVEPKVVAPPLLVANIESPTAMNHLFVGKTAGSRGGGRSGDGSVSTSRNRFVTDGPRISGPGQSRRQGGYSGRLSTQLQAVARAQAVSKSRRMRTGISQSLSQTHNQDDDDDGNDDDNVSPKEEPNDNGLSYSGDAAASENPQVHTLASEMHDSPQSSQVRPRLQNHKDDSEKVLQANTSEGKAGLVRADSKEVPSSNPSTVSLSCTDDGGHSKNLNSSSREVHGSDSGEKSALQSPHSVIVEEIDEIQATKGETSLDSSIPRTVMEEDCLNESPHTLVTTQENSSNSAPVSAKEIANIAADSIIPSAKHIVVDCNIDSNANDQNKEVFTQGVSPFSTKDAISKNSTPVISEEEPGDALIKSGDATSQNSSECPRLVDSQDSFELRKQNSDSLDDSLSHIGVNEFKCSSNNGTERLGSRSFSPICNEDSGVDSSPASSPMVPENSSFGHLAKNACLSMSFLDEEMILRVESESVETNETPSQDLEKQTKSEKHLQNIRVTMTMGSSGETAFEAQGTYGDHEMVSSGQEGTPEILCNKSVAESPENHPVDQQHKETEVTQTMSSNVPITNGGVDNELPTGSSPSRVDRSISMCSNDSISVLLEAVTTSSPVKEVGYVRSTSVIETVPVAETVDVDATHFIASHGTISAESTSEEDINRQTKSGEALSGHQEKKLSRNRRKISKGEMNGAHGAKPTISLVSSSIGPNTQVPSRKASLNLSQTKRASLASMPGTQQIPARRLNQPFNPFPVKHFNTNRMKAGLKLGLYTPSTLEQLRGLKPRTTSS